MSVYLIATININDRDTYARYEAGFMEIFSQYNGTMLAVDDNARTMEGQWDYTRTVLVQFPSAAEADAWFHSEAYQDIARYRREASVGNIVMLNGLG
ncbi:MAG: DUF1330 domain-containing protein [Pseudomonadota bacterium]